MSSREPIFLEPVFQEKIWGGDRLRTSFGYDIPSGHTGECWAISGHPGGDCRIKGRPGQTLGGLWREERALFGGLAGEGFPLLVKLLDAREDLSIQVHPDDSYARLHENGASGKTECWYILDCDPDATIIIGHHARSPRELREMVEGKRWGELLREVPVRPGDFFQIDPGCVHSIRGGTLLLETQQSSDVTYRFYDYDRLSGGRPRPLHIEESLAVTQSPFRPRELRPQTRREGGALVTELVRCPCYTVYRAVLDGRWRRDWDAPFVNISVLDGRGALDGTPVERGDHLLLPAGYGTMTLEGRLELICSHL